MYSRSNELLKLGFLALVLRCVAVMSRSSVVYLSSVEVRRCISRRRQVLFCEKENRSLSVVQETWEHVPFVVMRCSVVKKLYSDSLPKMKDSVDSLKELVEGVSDGSEQ